MQIYAKRYLARRALVVVWLDEYLRKYGPPPVHNPSHRNSLSVVGSGIESVEGSLARQSTLQQVQKQQQQEHNLSLPIVSNFSSLGRNIEAEFQRRPSYDAVENSPNNPTSPNTRYYNSELIEVEESQNGFNSDEEDEEPSTPTSPQAIRSKSLKSPISPATHSPIVDRRATEQAPRQVRPGFDVIESDSDEPMSPPSTVCSNNSRPCIVGIKSHGIAQETSPK
ncbi:hypothetical protein HDU97_003953 [Phlyctochytrium planicorne]|nr:hypothetical protein HDU97_003953 [Phlyctochytrium planicorne]